MIRAAIVLCIIAAGAQAFSAVSKLADARERADRFIKDGKYE